MNKEILYFILTVIAISCIIELAIFIFLSFNADSVTCNFIFCEFKTTMREIRQECYMNGEMVNCSGVDFEMGYEDVIG